MRSIDLVQHGLTILPYVMMVTLRVGVMFAMLPAPFGDVAPPTVRAILAFLVAFAISAPTLDSAYTMSTEPAVLLIGGLTETVVGAVIGLTVRAALAAAETAGTVAGTAMGLNFASQLDPLFGGESVPTAHILNSLAVLIFFVLSGHHIVIQALAASLVLAPPGGGVPSFDGTALIRIGGRIMAQGLRIAAPVVATLFLVQLGLALASKAAPKVQVFALSFGVLITMGVLVLLMSAPQLAQTLASVISTIPDAIAQIMPKVPR